jgi:hypothetical protein
MENAQPITTIWAAFGRGSSPNEPRERRLGSLRVKERAKLKVAAGKGEVTSLHGTSSGQER